MSSRAHIYLLDIISFRDAIVPGFQKLLLGQPLPAWITHILTRYKHHRFNASLGREMEKMVGAFKAHPVDLEHYCTYLHNLACIDPERFNPNLGHKPREVWQLQWRNRNARRCAETRCIEKTKCPFYVDNPQLNAELLNYLFIDAMSWVSKGSGTFLGRATTPAFYGDTLTELGVSTKAPLREMMDSLGTRGFIFGYGWANGDGVQGWLDARECGELAELLWQLDLPEYASTAENLDVWQPLKKSDSEEILASFVLAYLRALTEYGATHQLGVVWINGAPRNIRAEFGEFRAWVDRNNTIIDNNNG